MPPLARVSRLSKSSPIKKRREARYVHVLVVDESAAVRQIISTMLMSVRGITVEVAADLEFASGKIRRKRPDVIVMGGSSMEHLAFLKKTMAEDPIPVVLCSSFTGCGPSDAIRALEQGAVEIIPRPRLDGVGNLEESRAIMVDAILGASSCRMRAVGPAPGEAAVQPVFGRLKALKSMAFPATEDKILVMGASTGGVEALRVVLKDIRPDVPGIVVAQHMPQEFTRALADSLAGITNIKVREAANGDRVRSGCALVVPGNKHAVIKRLGARYFVEVMDGPLVNRRRPSLDVLFRSVAIAAGPNAVGVVLTGMAGDGANGLLEMKRAGAIVIAQDERSSLVFGLARQAISSGAVDVVAPLADIASIIHSMASEQELAVAG
jgi:two-component system chemotaxis response regulator CheB